MDFDTLVQGAGDAAQHGKRVALVIGIFEAADNGRRGSDEFSELPLAHSGVRAKLNQFAGHLVGCPSFLQRGKAFRFSGIKSLVKES